MNILPFKHNGLYFVVNGLFLSPRKGKVVRGSSQYESSEFSTQCELNEPYENVHIDSFLLECPTVFFCFPEEYGTAPLQTYS